MNGSHARVAKLADARDLKSRAPKGACRFNSGPGHQNTAFECRRGFPSLAHLKPEIIVSILLKIQYLYTNILIVNYCHVLTFYLA